MPNPEISAVINPEPFTEKVKNKLAIMYAGGQISCSDKYSEESRRKAQLAAKRATQDLSNLLEQQSYDPSGINLLPSTGDNQQLTPLLQNIRCLLGAA